MGFRYIHFGELDTTELAQERVPCLREAVNPRGIKHTQAQKFCCDVTRLRGFPQTQFILVDTNLFLFPPPPLSIHAYHAVVTIFV